MCSMTATPGSEDRPAYDVLARKTVEILDVVNSTRQLLIEQYNNDQTMWVEAIFRILMWKNPAFLQDERTSSTRNPNVHKFLKDFMLETSRSMNGNNPPSQNVALRKKLMEVGNNFISTFRVFSDLLSQSKHDVPEELENLQQINKNLTSYLRNVKEEKVVDRVKRKSEERNSLENEHQNIANETETVPANELEPQMMKLNEPLKVKPTSNEHSKPTSAEKVKPIGNENRGESTMPFDSPRMKPATSKRDINEETFGSEAIELARKDSVVDSEKRSTTPAKVGAADHLCEVCNNPITIFNFDKDFSLLLHEDDPKHQKAVKKKLSASRVTSCAELDGKKLALHDEIAAREAPGKAVVDAVGEVQARFFQYVVGDEFFCTLCKCVVYSIHNIISHVGGRNHRNNCGFMSQESRSQSKSQESKESKSGSDSRDLTSDEVDSADDEGVIRVGSTLPVKTLFEF